MSGELKYDPETGEPLIDGYPLYSGLPNRKRDAEEHMTYEEALQIAIEKLEDEVGYIRAMNKGFPRMQDHADRLQTARDTLQESQRNLKDEIEEGLDALPLIKVTEITENEDGSATAVIDTSVEGTRLLVELGLVSLLEKAIDAENTDYTIRDET